MYPQHLVLIAPSHLVEQVIAAWQRILPEEGVLYHTTVITAPWNGNTLAAFHADHPEYIEGLVEVIGCEITNSPCLMTCF
jgi:hypothetical protein